MSHLLCDFSSQASIRALAADILRDIDRLDVLVNNAGGVNKTRRLTVDGIEMTFAVNHLGYFLLTNLLRDLLARSAPARVVTVASIGHRRGTLDFADLGFERGGYSIMRAYMRSKLANVLFAAELARRLAGTGVTSNSLHPGSVATNIWSGAPTWAKPLIQILYRPFFISAEKGRRHHRPTGGIARARRGHRKIFRKGSGRGARPPGPGRGAGEAALGRERRDGGSAGRNRSIAPLANSGSGVEPGERSCPVFCR